MRLAREETAGTAGIAVGAWLSVHESGLLKEPLSPSEFVLHHAGAAVFFLAVRSRTFPHHLPR